MAGFNSVLGPTNLGAPLAGNNLSISFQQPNIKQKRSVVMDILLCIVFIHLLNYMNSHSGLICYLYDCETYSTSVSVL